MGEMRKKGIRGPAALLSVLVFAAIGSSASAATVTPTMLSDEYDQSGGAGDTGCSLREAVTVATNDNAAFETACAVSGTLNDDTILLSGAYTLSIAGTNEDNNANGDLDPNTGDGLVDVAPDNKMTFLDSSSASSISALGLGERVIDRRGPADGELELDGVDVLEGDTTQGGGAIYTLSGGVVELHDSKILRNKAAGAGGGMYLGTSGSLIADEGSVISDNESAANGGGGVSGGIGAISLTDTQVIGNRALGGIAGNGGGIETGGPVEIHGGVFSGNEAARSGGAISQQSAGPAQVLIDGGARIGTPADPNTATLTGGGIHIQDGNLALDGARVEGNEVNTPVTVNTYRGGGISIGNDSNVTISDSRIAGNSVTGIGAAGASGGGIGIGIGSNPVTISDSVIAGNSITSVTTSAFGSGLYVENGGGTNLTNVTVTDNSSAGADTATGAISAMTGSTVGLTHVTVAGNHSTAGTPGLFTNATITVRNSIVAEGGLPVEECSVAGGTIISQGYNVDQGTTCGFLSSEPVDTSIQGTDPQLGLFADNDADGLPESLALAMGSPAVGLIPNGVCTVSSDIRGYERPQPAGGACDAGSYELFTCEGAPFNGASASCPVIPPPPPPPGPGGNPGAGDPKRTKCKKGFKAKKIKGKRKCVRKKKKR